MTGMFSLLNGNFRGDAGGNGPINSTLDDGGGGASKSSSRIRLQNNKRQMYVMEGTK